MAANGDATITFDTNEFTYPDHDGITTHVVTNGQTIVMELIAAATGSLYKMLDGKTITCTDGSNLTFEADKTFTEFLAKTDGANTHRAGSIRIRENDGYMSDWEVSDIVINDVDEPTEITSALFTAKDGSNRQFTWTTITVAQ